MPALEHANVLYLHVPAVLQRDRLVGLGERTLAGHAPGQHSGAVDQTASLYRDVLEFHAPDQGVLPVAVAEILICVPLVRLGKVIALLRGGGCGLDHGPVGQSQGDVVLEAYGIAAVDPVGKIHDSSSVGEGRVDGLVDCRGVDLDAVSGRSEITYIVDFRLGGDAGKSQDKEN